jgi:putative SOS response-associated peptidase YedK
MFTHQGNSNISILYFYLFMLVYYLSPARYSHNSTRCTVIDPDHSPAQGDTLKAILPPRMIAHLQYTTLTQDAMIFYIRIEPLLYSSSFTAGLQQHRCLHPEDHHGHGNRRDLYHVHDGHLVHCLG